MPELPEVETVAHDLNIYIAKQVIIDITQVGKDHKILHTPLHILRKNLKKEKVKQVFRRAKMVVIETQKFALVIHLKMTGQLIYTHHKPLVAGGHPIISTGIKVPNKFTRVIITFKNGGVLYFNDTRKFGWIKLLTLKEFKELDERAGIEPLSKRFTLDFFKSIISGRRTPIKAILLDQKRLVGLGNIYVDEVLFQAHVRPNRMASTLTNKEITVLYRAIPVILKSAIKQRGTTFSNFLDPTGLRGNFMNFLKVYGRDKQACLVCGRRLRKTRVAGRDTHWCEYCQH